MKIAVIASTAEVLASIKDLLEKKSADDQYIFLNRQDGEIHLERLDLFSTNILIIDAVTVTEGDLKVITACTRDHHNPAIIFISQTLTEKDLSRLMHAGVSEALHFPVNGQELYSALEQIRSRHYLSSLYHPRGKVLTFISSKGGAGATLLATNIGYLLACEFDKKVLFIDLHMQGGDATFYVTDQTSAVTLGDIVKQVGLDSTVIATAALKIADNYFMLQAPESPEKSSGIGAQHIDNLITVAIQDYDYVILDIPQNLDSVNMKALDRADLIFPVMQPMVNYLRAMVKQLHVFSMLGYADEKIKVLLNRMDPTVSLSVAIMEETINRSVAKLIPNDFQHVVESVNTGVPIVQLAPHATVCESLRSLCKELTGTSPSESEVSVFKKIFSWLE
ncbi:MAG: AAA family ATPase [Sheuella sp.]|nr:AAA family ATPase [Sheuella sp.]